MENIVETIIYAVLIVLSLAGMWKSYEKAGEAGWKAIIPVYNMVVLAKIVKKPWWWALLMLIPYLGMIWSIWAMNLFAKSFGKGVGYTIGLVVVPFIFYPILGYGKAQFVGLESKQSPDNSDTDQDTEEPTESETVDVPSNDVPEYEEDPEYEEEGRDY